MTGIFNSGNTLLQTFWILGLVGTGIFVILLILSLIGGGDVDMEVDGDDLGAGDDGGVGFQFFTFKNMTAFFAIFGWTGVVCLDAGMGKSASIAIAIIAGLAMMALTSALFYWMYKLAHNGTLRINNAVGSLGEVYLPIGAERSSIGKIQIKVQGALRELDAITDETETLSTTSIVKVKEVVSGELLLVEKLKSNK